MKPTIILPNKKGVRKPPFQLLDRTFLKVGIELKFEA
jgi:hypothetical protein